MCMHISAACKRQHTHILDGVNNVLSLASASFRAASVEAVIWRPCFPCPSTAAMHQRHLRMTSLLHFVKTDLDIQSGYPKP